MQYPTIAQPQYGFGPTMPPGMYDTPPALMNFNKGGLASLSLPEMAEKVRAAGRGGDTILAHITPEEAGILQLLGGSGTINPKTGQPEYIRKYIKKIIPREIYEPISSIGKALEDIGTDIGQGIERGVESIARNKYLGPIAQMASYLHPVSAALYAGLAPEGSSFDVKRAAKAAALQQIGEAAYNYAQGAPGDGLNAFSDPVGDIADGGGGFDLGYGGEGLDTAALPVDQVGALREYPSVIKAVSSPYPDVGEIPGVTSFPGATPPTPPTFMESATKYVSEIPSKIEAGIKSLPETVSNLPGQALKAITPTSAKDALLTASLATTAYGSVKSLQELEDQKKEAEKILTEKENKTKEQINWAQSVLRDYPINYQRLTAEEVAAEQKRSTSPSVSTLTPTVSPAPRTGYSRLTAEDILKEKEMADGGLASLNAFKSGGSPRFLKGRGDGMSDDIPAIIGSRQKAALSDGEFVIPADVVSHLGNGSSRAGAKKLYKMMDNIRRARTGKKRQAPEVSADRYMPA